MALSASRLGAAMKAAVDGVGAPSEGALDAYRTAVFAALAQAIITEFTANAAVVTAGTATGVMAGGGTAPTASTGTIS